MANTITSPAKFQIKTINHGYANFTQELQGQWSGPFYFIQAADTQFGMIESYLEKKENPRWDKEIALTRKAIQAANQMRPRPKFFVVCGDMLDALPDVQPDLRSEQERDFKAVFSELSSEIPLVCVCGNHDIGNTPSRQTVSVYRSSFGDDFFSFWVGGVFFIVLNSQYYWDPSQVRELADEQDAWLESQLAFVKKAKHGVVFQHIPWFTQNPDEPKQKYFNIDLPLRRKMLDKLKNAGVTKVFCGHYHRNAGGTDGDLEVVVTSAIGAQLGSDVHGFRVVSVLDKSIEHKYYPLASVPLKIDQI